METPRSYYHSPEEESSAALLPGVNPTLVPPALRIRSDSTGSTRGAFGIANNNDRLSAAFPNGNRKINKNRSSAAKSFPKPSEATNVDTFVQPQPQSALNPHFSLGTFHSGSGDEPNILPSYQHHPSHSVVVDGPTLAHKPALVHGASSGTLNGTYFLPQAKIEDFSPFHSKEQRKIFAIHSLYSNLHDSFHSNLHDFYYAPSEKIGPFIRGIRSLLYDPTNPEFTSLQQTSWAVILGVFFGVATALWGRLIEASCEFVWKDIPSKLLQWGAFTELDGIFPLPHYCWLCTAVFGGFLSWVSVSLPISIPGQNEWIEGVHRQGILDPSSFWYIFLISTGGMMSGLSLGPELPLVLLSGMVGSFLAVRTHQSVLSARVMVFTAGGAAVGGFFGFPMAGALFVLELPHRMGLQYFEALSPANVSSIISVLFNRIVTGNDLMGYYNYPFLASSLKSHVFYIAIVYGLIGALVGTVYCKAVMSLKLWVHDWFHPSHSASQRPICEESLPEENLPLVGSNVSLSLHHKTLSLRSLVNRGLQKVRSFSISHEPTRATVIGVVSGFFVGVIGMFLPHNFFWGEAQLQTLIDKGRSPLPFLGRGGESNEALLAWSYCLVDPSDTEATLNGPGLLCNFSLFVSKYICIGLSVGTGIVGGQFWGPLYVGAVASNFFVDLMKIMHKYLGLGSIFFEHPCMALLCIMGSAHVVVFRAHTAIMILLTLTISSFQDDQTSFFTGGDYAAVFPLLVVSCFVSLMVTRGVVFYKQQRCRGDIIASPEVLCEPGKAGQPMMHVPVAAYDDADYGSTSGSYASSVMSSEVLEGSSFEEYEVEERRDTDSFKNGEPAPLKFVDTVNREPRLIHQDSNRYAFETTGKNISNASISSVHSSDIIPQKSKGEAKVEELLNYSIAPDRSAALRTKKGGSHRRIASGSDAMLSFSNTEIGRSGRERASSYDGETADIIVNETISPAQKKSSRRQRSSSRDSARSITPTQGVLMMVNSKGKIEDFQPSLMDQGRKRASSVQQPKVPKPSHHSRRPVEASHSRVSSEVSVLSVAISQDEIEQAFSSIVQTSK